MKQKHTIKRILLSNGNWWRFFNKNKHKIRNDITTCIIKLLSCKHKIRGRHEYHCANPDCSHIKYINFTCKCKACSSCGKKSTEVWLQKQLQILPNTSWQHITFTMPCELWDFFWHNRQLLNVIAKIAADCIKKIARKRKITPGIFIAIHTFGRDLKRNVHIHLSTTMGGISENGSQWKNLFFDQATIMRMWRYHIIKLFRKTWKKDKLIIPSAIKQQLNSQFTFSHLLERLYQKTWIVHCAKPSHDHKQNLKYLSRYIKRPPIAESKLRHYDGNEVAFKYLDHKTKQYRRFTLTVEHFIARFIQHIPDIGFRMVRYYGFLAHRVRGTLLPSVYKLLGQINTEPKPAPTYAQLMKINFNVEAFICILCGQQLRLSGVYFGKTSTHQLFSYHRQLALLKKI